MNPPKVDERFSGPRIFGGIIKDPPSHRESEIHHFLRMLGNGLEIHESVRYPDRTRCGECGAKLL